MSEANKRARIEYLISLISERDAEIARLTTALLQIAREGECVYARRLALAAINASTLSSQMSQTQGE